MARSFNPWRFGSVAIPPDLRQEIIETELPVIPAERLYVQGPDHGRGARLPPWRRLVAYGVILVATGLVLASLWVPS